VEGEQDNPGETAKRRLATVERARTDDDRFRAMSDAAPVLIWETDETGVVFLNQHYLDFFGADFNAVRQMGWAKFLHPDDADLYIAAYREAFARREPYTYDCRFLRADGEYRWLRNIGQPFGERRFVGSSVDVTDSKRVEDALRGSEGRLAAEISALGRLNDASSRLWRLPDLQTGLDEILKATIEMLGADMGHIQLYDREQRAPRIAVQRGFNAQFLDFFREVMTEDESASGRALPTGERTIVEDIELDAASQALRPIARTAGYRAVQSTPLTGRDGAPLGMLSTHWRSPRRPSEQDLRRLDLYVRQASDFVERFRSDEVLRERDRRYRALFEAIDEGFCIIEFLDGPHGPLSDYVHVEANPAYARHAGIPNVVGQKLRDMVPDEADDWLARYRPVLETGRPIRFEQELLATGRRLDLAAFRVEPPERRQVAVLFTDITARWQAEAKLKAADRRKDEFLAMLGHELRNPLAPIRNAVEVMKRIGSSEPRADWARDIIERQAQHLTRLIDDLLDVSRITLGKVTLKRQRLQLSVVVNGAVEASRPLIEAKRHQLSVVFPADPVEVEGDLTRLVQIVSNLLNNAAKYTDEGGDISVEVAANHAVEEAVVRVRDNGMGLAADLLPHVFDLFIQAERAVDRSQGGLGIGLTLVRQLVEMHGGRVEARSDGPGRGSEFVFYLPLAKPGVSGAQDLEVPPALSAPRAALRVLVVEDNVDSAELLNFMLQLGGHETRMAHDGSTALDIARTFQPDVILCDIGLPRISGYDVAAGLRRQPEFQRTVLIALTGYGQDEDRRRAEDAGFNYHLTKPVEPEALAALLDSLRADEDAS